MRQYKSKFLKSAIRTYSEQMKESQDGIIHSVDTSNRWCAVAIQGSDNLIRAYYPENWDKIPFWCKVGNCVRFSYCGGNRGRTEVLGMGILRPTPIADSTLGDPVDTVVLDDAVISGLQVMEIPYGEVMRVMITVGEARFGGATATSQAIRMESSNYKMGMGGQMGNVKAIVNVGGAPGVGYWRYDLIEMSSDLVVDIDAGTNFDATADIPTTAAGHISLGLVLVPSCTTSIGADNINAEWSAAKLNRISMDISDTDLSWSQTAATVTISLLDQYGSPYTPPDGNPFQMNLRILSGSGQITKGSVQSTAYVMGQTTSTNLNFLYSRHVATSGSNIDQSPILEASVISQSLISQYGNIILRDSGGTILTS